MPTTTDADKVAYCSCMNQVSRRLGIVRAITFGTVRSGDPNADAEFACLQLRKTLELVAFATLCANRERYAQIRADVGREWRATKILERLRKANADFYPQPVKDLWLPGRQWRLVPTPADSLTEDDFVFLYDRCSDAIHEWNPFDPRPRNIDLKRPVADWAGRIERLLKLHLIRLIDQDDVLVVELVSADGKARVVTGTPTL
jgi:hypothetical protein